MDGDPNDPPPQESDHEPYMSVAGSTPPPRTRSEVFPEGDDGQDDARFYRELEERDEQDGRRQAEEAGNPWDNGNFLNRFEPNVQQLEARQAEERRIARRAEDARRNLEALLAPQRVINHNLFW